MPASSARRWVASAMSTLLLFLCISLYAFCPNGPNDLFRNSPSLLLPDHAPAMTPPNLLVSLHPDDHQSRDNATVHLDWTITKGLRFPDGVAKLVYLVNDQFPCPHIEARSGDAIVIDLHNGLEDEGLALHFHGLHMQGANHMDGVVGVTQKAIAPGEDFTYSFPVSPNQAGTFWWHAHSELMRADGLYGALIIHPSEDDASSAAHVDTGLYGEDTLLIVGDWYHHSAADIQETYDTWTSWGLEPAPDSMLLNGFGSFNCSRTTHLADGECVAVLRPEFTPHAPRSRVRIINAGSMTGISINLPAERITVLTVDGGNPVDPDQDRWTSLGVLHPGERADILIDWAVPSSAEDGQDYLEVEFDREYFRKKNLALEPNQKFSVKSDNVVGEGTPAARGSSEKKYDLSTARGAANATEPLGDIVPSQDIVVYTKVEILAHLENRPKGYINHTFWEPMDETPLIATTRMEWDEHQLVPFIQMAPGTDTWVDIVINNVDEQGHPFHLHGYDFYVVSRFQPDIPAGWNAYNPFSNHDGGLGGPYNLVNPLRKDTVYVPPAGYVVLRINARNPGLWFLHCHILWHQGVGMAMTLEVREDGPSGGQGAEGVSGSGEA